jgi:hypothetical protein
MAAYAISERMARSVEYLQEEVMVLGEVYTAATGREAHPVRRSAALPAIR